MVTAKNGVINKEYYDRKIIDNIGDDIIKIYKVFEFFNKDFFDGELDMPVITISPNLKVEYRVDKPGAWKKEKNEKVDDELFKIVLSEKIFQYDTKEIYIILLKAMVMQYDIEKAEIYKAAGARWIRLINNNNNYFGKKYYIFCEKIGLKVEITESGEKKVVAGERFNQIYEDRDIEKYYNLVHKYIKDDKRENNKSQSMRSFICPSCGMIIRITKSGDTDIRCYNENREGIPCNGKKFVEKK